MSGQLAFRCGVCRKKQRVGAEFSGRRAMCPSCRSTFVIPTMEQVLDALPERLLVFPVEEPAAAGPVAQESGAAEQGGEPVGAGTAVAAPPAEEPSDAQPVAEAPAAEEPVAEPPPEAAWAGDEQELPEGEGDELPEWEGPLDMPEDEPGEQPEEPAERPDEFEEAPGQPDEPDEFEAAPELPDEADAENPWESEDEDALDAPVDGLKMISLGGEEPASDQLTAGTDELDEVDLGLSAESRPELFALELSDESRQDLLELEEEERSGSGEFEASDEDEDGEPVEPDSPTEDSGDEIVELQAYDMVPPDPLDDSGLLDRSEHILAEDAESDTAEGPVADPVSEVIVGPETLDEVDDSGFEEVISSDDLPAYGDSDDASADEIEISDGYESSAALKTLPTSEELYGAQEEEEEEEEDLLEASATQQTHVLDAGDAPTGSSETAEILPVAEEHPTEPEEEQQPAAWEGDSDSLTDSELYDEDEDLEDEQVFLEDDLDDQLIGAPEEDREETDLGALSVDELADRVNRARRAGDVGRTEELLHEALARYEASGALLLERGHLKAAKGDLEGAVDDFLIARDQGFDDSGALRVIDRYELDTLLDQAHAFIREEPQRAANLLRGILAERPDYARAHHYLGLALEATGEEEMAAESYARARELGYEPVEADQLAEPEVACPEPEAAPPEPEPDAVDEAMSDEFFEVAETQETEVLEVPAAPLSRARYQELVGAGQAEEAARALAERLAEDPEAVHWRRVQLGARIQEERWSEALEDLVLLSRHAEEDPALRESLGLMLCWFDVLDALSGLRQAVEHEPANGVLRELLADLAARVGDFEQAITLYSQLLERHPEERRLLLKRATCWRQRTEREPGRALEDVDRAFPDS